MSKHFIGVGLPKLLSTARHVHEMFSNVPGFRGIADAVNMYVPGKAACVLGTLCVGLFFSNDLSTEQCQVMADKNVRKSQDTVASRRQASCAGRFTISNRRKALSVRSLLVPNLTCSTKSMPRDSGSPSKSEVTRMPSESCKIRA